MKLIYLFHSFFFGFVYVSYLSETYFVQAYLFDLFQI